MALDPSVDLDRHTGGNVAGWASVIQSLEVIFTTRFGERVMREWFGSAVPKLLGENMNTQTIVPFFSAVGSAIDQWEPRFRLTQIVPLSVGRDGRFEVELQGEYRPRALVGDFTAEGQRRIRISGGNGYGLRFAA